MPSHWVWFFQQGPARQAELTPPTGNSHNRCLGWATCGAGLLLTPHALSRDQTNIFHRVYHAFVKKKNITGEPFTAHFTTSVNLNLCECLQVYICVSVHLILKGHGANQMKLKCALQRILTNIATNADPYFFFIFRLHIISFMTMII